MFKRIKMTIENMSCKHCILNVHAALDSIPRVIDIKRIKIGSAVVLASKDLSNEEIVRAVEKSGMYKVKTIS